MSISIDECVRQAERRGYDKAYEDFAELVRERQFDSAFPEELKMTLSVISGEMLRRRNAKYPYTDELSRYGKRGI